MADVLSFLVGYMFSELYLKVAIVVGSGYLISTSMATLNTVTN